MIKKGFLIGFFIWAFFVWHKNFLIGVLFTLLIFSLTNQINPDIRIELIEAGNRESSNKIIVGFAWIVSLSQRVL